MFKQKKGQAAMEFLMTYGWAILAAIIVVGVLWYLIGNPANLAGSRFQVSAPLVSKGLVISGTGIVVNVLNGAGDYINVTSVNATAIAGCVWTGSNVIGVGNQGNFSLSCAFTSGSRINTDVVFKFKEGASTFEQQATGSISGKVP